MTDSSRSEETKRNRQDWGAFGAITLIHYGAIFLYVVHWNQANEETSYSSAVFFVGMAAWLLELCLCIILRKSNPTVSRLGLVVFIPSLIFGLLMTPPTD